MVPVSFTTDITMQAMCAKPIKYKESHIFAIFASSIVPARFEVFRTFMDVFYEHC